MLRIFGTFGKKQYILPVYWVDSNKSPVRADLCACLAGPDSRHTDEEQGRFSESECVTNLKF